MHIQNNLQNLIKNINTIFAALSMYLIQDI